MKFSDVGILVILSSTTLASSNWFTGGAQTDARTDDANVSLEAPLDFNPSELLDFKARKPEVYTNAMVELKRLEQEPICHRTAAQLLMDNCRGIEEIDASSSQWGTAHIQRHHVESFANGLTVCDMERARFVVPGACNPFGSAALFRAVRDKHSRLDVTQDQVTDCLQALTRDHSHWNTWLSNRDKAVTVCRAARLDIDKDQAILIHKQLIELMEQFTTDVEGDLARLKENLKASSHFANSLVDDMTKQAAAVKAKLNNVFETVSQDMKGVDLVIKSIFSSGNDVLQMFKLSMQTVLQGNAEMAAEQEKALTTATNSFQRRVGEVNSVISETEASVLVIQDALQQLVPMVIALHERQNTLEEKAQAALLAVMNATELLQGHTQNLQQASDKASGINNDLDRAVITAQTWHETLGVSNSVPDWALRVMSPMATLVLGNFGITRTASSNLFLAGSGYVCGESLVQARHVWAYMPVQGIFTSKFFRNSNSEFREKYNIPSLVMAPTELENHISAPTRSSVAEIYLDMI